MAAARLLELAVEGEAMLKWGVWELHYGCLLAPFWSHVEGDIKKTWRATGFGSFADNIFEEDALCWLDLIVLHLRANNFFFGGVLSFFLFSISSLFFPLKRQASCTITKTERRKLELYNRSDFIRSRTEPLIKTSSVSDSSENMSGTMRVGFGLSVLNLSANLSSREPIRNCK